MSAESTVRVIFLGDSAQAVRSVSRLEGSFASLGRASKLLVGALGVALVGALVASTKAAIDFQHQMELIHTQAGASTKEVERMSKAILQLAGSVGTAPEDLAKGLFHIESAGIRGAHALEILKAAAEGAKVGQANLEDTTNALIGAFTSGVKGAGSMEHAMAVLNATVGAGNMRMSDLTAAMGTGLLSAAKGVGISMQDVGAALAELTVQNENASEASTRLQMAFLTMAANTTKGAAALKSIGITQNQLANDMRTHGLIFALNDLQTSLVKSGMTATQQTAIIADVFGRRSLKAILPLLQHLDDVKKRQEEINRTTGNFGQAWEATTQTVQFQMDRAKAAIQAAFIPIGTLMLPLVTRLAQGVAAAAGEITSHMQIIQRVSREVVQGISADWKRLAIPAMQGFRDEAQTLVATVKSNWPRMQSTAESVGKSFQSVFKSMGQIITSLGPLIKALEPEFKIALAAILVALKLTAGSLALYFKAMAAAMKVVAPVLTYLVNGFNTGASQMVSAAKSVASGVTSAFDSVVGAIKTFISWIEKLIGWIEKIPHDISVHLHVPGAGIAGKIGGVLGHIPGFADGGVVPGHEGAPVQILAHAGEVVLNRSQQAALGGAAFFQRAFGFSGNEGRSFATGGIVTKRPAKTPHHSPHAGGKHLPKLGTPPVLAKIMRDINSFEDTKSYLDQEYQNLASRYSVLDGNQNYINDDGTVNTTFVTQRQKELLTLLQEREKLLATMDQEQAELDRGIKVLRQLIERLTRQLKAERDRVESDNRQLARLTGMIATESQKKKPDAKKIAAWRHQISLTTADRSQARSSISKITSAINNDQSLLAGWTHDAKFLPLDRYGIQTDVIDLQQQLGTLGTPASVIATYGGGSAGGSAASSGADVAALLAEIGQLNLALSLQGAQSGIIGSFAKGTLSVPETGLALVHAGEQIVPAGQVRGGDGAYSSVPPVINLSLSGPLEPLAQFITATVDTPQMADRISVRIGTKATERARSGRM